MKPLVYVAGPVTSNPWGCVRDSMETFTALRSAGCIPFMPQWSIIAEIVEPVPCEEWLAYDFDIIARCDALFRLAGDSPGADREVEHAKTLGLPVFSDLFDIEQWATRRAA